MRYSAAIAGVVLGYQWIIDALFDVRGGWRQLPAVLVLALVIAHNVKSGDWGFSRRAFVPALKWTVILTTPIVLALWVIGHSMGPAPDRARPWLDFLYLIVWGGGQQWALQTVVLREAERVTRRGAFVLAALIFATLHLPNPFLTTVTAIGALSWCWIYARHPNIIPLAISHAASTVVILLSFHPSVTGGLRTGAAYFR
jgi:membrane protease YdiL (CAAX protease family)